MAEVVERPKGELEAAIFAPADVSVLARLANGLAADFVEEVASYARPAIVAPDLDRDVADHPAVKRNIRLLRERGFVLVEGARGGMASADAISDVLLGALGGPLSGLRLLVTAGGTREPIDSVRFVGNRSSGRMGRAVARESLRMGAEVSVVAANMDRSEAGMRWVPVETFEQLRAGVMRLAGEADALVMAAAVSDFTPASPEKSKIRRRERLVVEMKATGDILKAVREENPDLFVVGFAATHGDPLEDAREKLRSKGVDLVVGNDISQAGIGFGTEENEVYVVGHSQERFVPKASKNEIARAILNVLAVEMEEERRDWHGGENRS